MSPNDTHLTDARALGTRLLRHVCTVLFAALVVGGVGCASNGTLPSAPTSGPLTDGMEAAAQQPSEEDTGQAPEEEDEFFDPFALQDEGGQAVIEEYDPWQPYNEVVFEFNYRLDKYLFKPLAQGYDFVVPDAAQRGVSNAFHNVRFAPRFFNNVFQGKFKGAGLEVSRFLINTTIGIGGLFDPAEDLFDLTTPDEDFGQTLGYYGVEPGPYVLIPFFPQPFTVRDAVGFVVDLGLDPWNYLVLPFVEVESWPQVVTNENRALWLNWGLRGMEILNTRSLNLETFQGVEEAAIDLYGAVRNGYLQSRAKAIQE